MFPIATLLNADASFALAAFEMDHGDPSPCPALISLHSTLYVLGYFLSSHTPPPSVFRPAFLANKRNELMLPIYEKRRAVIEKIDNFWTSVFMNNMTLTQVIEPTDIPVRSNELIAP